MKNYLYGYYVFAGLALFSSTLIAAEESAGELAGETARETTREAVKEAAIEPAAPISQDVLTSQAIMQMLLGLALVVVVILLLAWALRRVSNLHQSHQKMKIVSSLSLGTRERAVLIEVGDRQLLLGVAAGHVSLLESFPEKVISTAPKSEFAKTLKDSMKESIVAGDSK
ncbi:flagellar biosynthetic protein FliO [Neptunomonas qingdaonensis]|uniref:Flagellar protein n=1 Tax=Neptunomonas qingdaonensis TaxID=1045558 RepID=A0A1I2N247_9GAMM|nr:flagellar biosynthetic protein FliO [Neptunomonas qingdaonensis]SFF96929.1 flagellar biosynthetic protein FliO [Neptunomonas qingdaonensis]